MAGLNAYQPLALMGYPSMLALLAVEARPVGCGSGLGGSPPPASPCSPRCVVPSPRPSTPPCPTCTGPRGRARGRRLLLRPRRPLCDDLVIVEPVDLDGRPVPPGVRSDKLYLTALANPTLPLIRFELTDQVQFLDIPCACGSAHQLVADVEGRLDDVFTYPGGLVVHPLVFGSVLRRDRGIVEHQVRQTRYGAESGSWAPRPTRPRSAGRSRPSWPASAWPMRRSRSVPSTSSNARPRARSACSSRWAPEAVSRPA